ncbi:hypothetical protein NONO_c49550 [Nocardia nova SH22a]|uniref:Uncharacterized protein n=1 Tax=Nocardia nova SH22a TaxID=1415166 RepID=W5TKP0_9NOCA|nr:hypothetical protein [Nocardia nova]AHH19739.1 hypothetical protein NONO_c49550 [Nocardia nova SH22a]
MIGLFSDTGRAESRSAERTAVLRDLGEPGCPLCRTGDGADLNWHNWYVIETHSDPGYRMKVAHAGGFCAEHLRGLCLDSEGRGHLPQMFADVVAAVLAHPENTLDGRCPACASREAARQHHLRRLAEQLADDEVMGALAASDYCLPHLQALLHGAPPAATADLVSSMIGTLADARTDSLTLLVPLNSDLARSARIVVHTNDIRKAADELTAARTGFDRAVADLDRACCPLCRARAHAELRYVTWLVGQRPAELDSVETWLCPEHLGIATLFGYAAAGQLAGIMRAHTLARLRRLYERVDAATAHHALPHRVTDSVHSMRRGAGLAEVLHPPKVREHVERFERDSTPCAACVAAGTAENRERALLSAAMADRTVRDHWEHGHGPCLAHAHRFGERLPHTVVRQRLRLLAWELDETLRKRAWTARNEPVTPVEQAWRRAVPLLRGAAFLGSTAKEWQEAGT